MSRLSFRPRPLDIHKKLPIVKSVKDLDNDEGAGVSRTVQHNHIALDAENELVLSTPTRRGGGTEIPTPNFEVVESYERDYTRSFNQPPSYLRGRGARSEASEYVEYDLDDEDEDWLQQLNAERRILSPERFEWMLYKMELLDHKSRERFGGVPASQGVQSPVLQQDVAMDALRAQTSRLTVLSAVYEYWRAKRDSWQKPILRRLQPPPPVNDTNPFNVFRPREKVHRPHTRRMQRRENDVLSFDKLRQVRRNLEQSRNLMLAVQKREEKKRELVECEVNLQRVQIKLKHEPRLDDDGTLATNSSVFTNRKFPPLKHGEEGHSLPPWSNFGVGSVNQINGHGVSARTPLELSTPVADGAVGGDQMDRLKHKRKRRRLPPPRARPMRRVKVMDSLEPVLLFTKPLDAEKLAAAGILPPMEPPIENGSATAPCHYRGRIGRGGRIVFDRWNPLTRTPIVSSSCSFASPSSTSPIRHSFHAPPPPRLDIQSRVDATAQPRLNSASASAGVEHTSSTNVPPS